MLTLDIASACHKINKAYCESLGDFSQPEWDDLNSHQFDSTIAGVELHMNRDATPSDSHYSWMACKVADGWKYGPIKDAELKEHPCMVPYAELSQEQRSKDFLFRAVVHAMLDFDMADRNA